MSERGAKQHFSIQALQIIDAVLIWFAFVLAAAIREPVRVALGMTGGGVTGFEGMTWVVFVAVPMTPLLLEKFGHYDRLLSKSTSQSFNGLLRGVLLMMFIVGCVSVFGKLEGTRRLILGTGFVLSFVFLGVRMHLTSKFLRRRAKDEGFLERVVLAGGNDEIEEFLSEVDSEVYNTWKIVSRFDIEKRPIEELEELMRSESVQRVVFLSGHTEFERVARAVESC
ncbi:hypothetical protein N9230_04745, partial [Akkermansiaceae bacterium]|nr:hypothetical protein [Akkermansiaceae bacterium]